MAKPIIRKKKVESPRQGDIWMIRVDDGVRLRPVVVVSRRGYVVAEIVRHREEIVSGFHRPFDWFNAGLNEKSEIKFSRLETLDKTDFVRKTGRLKKEEIQALIQDIKNIVL